MKQLFKLLKLLQQPDPTGKTGLGQICDSIRVIFLGTVVLVGTTVVFLVMAFLTFPDKFTTLAEIISQAI